MTRKQKRLAVLTACMLALAGAVTLALMAFQENIVFFFSPSDLQARTDITDRRIRLGGLVEQDSIKRQADGLTIQFKVTDNAHTITVVYKGILPDLFREGQGVVTEGRMNAKGVFVASEVLAKHDENYMPREVADALKKTGHWQGEKQ